VENWKELKSFRYVKNKMPKYLLISGSPRKEIQSLFYQKLINL
jgi:hypothetical protein